MKTNMIKTFLVFALLSAAGAIKLAASEDRVFHSGYHTGGNEIANSGNFYEWAESLVKCPSFIQDASGKNRVEVFLQTSSDGRIHVASVLGDDARLCEHVRQSLEGKIAPEAQASAEYHFAIRFKRIA